MVEKLSSGVYECKVCGQKLQGHKKAKNHEQLCGIEKLTAYIENYDTLWNLEVPEDDDAKTEENTQQLSFKKGYFG